jgi:hypothetical protein
VTREIIFHEKTIKEPIINFLLGQSLTDALSAVPCPYPHLARAVVEVTPIDSQAVTIAARQGFVDWINREAGDLEVVRPEGYSNWRSLYHHIRSEGISENALVAVGSIAIMSEEAAAHREPAVAQARAKAAAEAQVVHADPNVAVSVAAPAANPPHQLKAEASAANPVPDAIARSCAKYENMGDGLKNRAAEIITWVKGLSDANRKTLIAELCTDAYPATAHAVIRACINMADNLRHKYCEFVRVIVQSEIQIPIPTVAEVRRATH